MTGWDWAAVLVNVTSFAGTVVLLYVNRRSA